MKTIWERTYGHSELDKVAAEVVKALGPGEFCLWLRGTLGAGKTTLTGYMLKELGLPKDASVTSPTYTYMNDYKIGDSWYAHLDLYRARGHISPEELGLADARPFRGIFIEWPEKSPDDPYLQPTHVLDISFADGGERRRYQLQGVAP